ncbi:beta-propeller fold lactonase family protein [Leptospira brenneri]|uniref:6-phosphogluconolactonase n=1 Tax=Leptospira brenneri TaxID=2023182 RepID=A0A2M9Y491_9LEPT|nr:beta-propeller fold lactonase family protein [Leptospira brenneri]PJZ46401.1 6-phosphogluconolactonase [Leptospira brenneri]TGK96502.1 6-phosphogluconolactonase [Leptospira brenneri]
MALLVSMLKRILFFFFLFCCLFSFNACLLNPIVRDLLFPEKDPSSKSLLGLLALTVNTNTRVELNHSWAGVRKGESLQLEASYFMYGSKVDSTFQWSSSNPSVATVDANGFVQSIGNGKVYITATSADGRAGASSDITVYTGYVYASLDTSNLVGHLTMNHTTGVLTPTGTIYVGLSTGPTGIAADPSGKYLFTGDFYGGTISQFLINQTTGVLTANSTPTAPAGIQPRNIVITPDGRYLYLASQGTMAIRAYAINANGTLTFINSYSTSNLQTQIQISRNGNFIFYLSSAQTELVSYRINYSDGTLTQAGVSPAFTNTGSDNVATHPNGNFLYVGSYPDLTILRLDPETGSMNFVDSVNHAKSINGSAIHPSGLFYYLIHMIEGIIACYTIDPITGKIAYASAVTGYSTTSLRFMVIDPTGRFAYVADNGGDLLQFSINQITGELTLIGSVDPGGVQWNLIFL